MSLHFLVNQELRTLEIVYRSPLTLNNFAGVNDLRDENFDYVTWHSYLYLNEEDSRTSSSNL